MDRGEFVNRIKAEQITFGEVIYRHMETISVIPRNRTETGEDSHQALSVSPWCQG